MNQYAPSKADPLPDVYRMLTPNEHRFLNAPNANISLVVRITGKVTASQFQEAIKKARLKHPLLGVKIKYDETYRSWFTNTDVPINPIRILTRDSDSQWYDELCEEHQNYLDMTHYPLIRFVLLIGKEGADFIIFANHATCDGMSLSYLARDIVYFLAYPDNQVTSPILPVPLDDEHTTPSLKVSALARFIMDKMDQKWQTNPVFFDTEAFRSVHTAFWRKTFYNIVYRQLSKPDTERLVQACRAHSVTVNTAICTAFSAAIHSIHTTHHKYMDVIGVAVNMRDLMCGDQKDFFGFSASGIAANYKYNTQIDFWANAQKLHKQIQRKLTKQVYVKNLSEKFLMSHAMSEAMLMAVYGKDLQPGDRNYEEVAAFRQDDKNVVINMLKKRKMLNAQELQIAFVCTNLGRATYPESFGEYEIRSMIFTPSAALLMECVVGVITIGGQLNLTVSNLANTDSKEELESLTGIAFEFLMSPITES